MIWWLWHHWAWLWWAAFLWWCWSWYKLMCETDDAIREITEHQRKWKDEDE